MGPRVIALTYRLHLSPVVLHKEEKDYKEQQEKEREDRMDQLSFCSVFFLFFCTGVFEIRASQLLGRCATT